MAKQKKATQTPDENGDDAKRRTRVLAEFTLLGDSIDDGKTVELAKVKGTTAARAIFDLAATHLDDKYTNFRLGKFSTVSF